MKIEAKNRLGAAKAVAPKAAKLSTQKVEYIIAFADEWKQFAALAKTFDFLTSSSAGDDALTKRYDSAKEMKADVTEVIKFFGGPCYSEVGNKLLAFFTESLADAVKNNKIAA